MAPNRSPEAIEQDIDATRRRAAQTVAALERKLSPRRIAGQVGESLRGNSYFRSMVRAAGDSPTALLLIAAGLGLLAYNSVRRREMEEEAGELVFGGPPLPGPRAEQVLPAEGEGRFRHHRHVAGSRPDVEPSPPPGPDRLLGRRKAGKSAAESAEVFR